MKTLLLLIALVCTASGQEKPYKIVGATYFFDSSRTLYFQGRAVKEIISENDSLRHANKRLQFLYDKTLGLSRKYRKQIDSLTSSKTTPEQNSQRRQQP